MVSQADLELIEVPFTRDQLKKLDAWLLRHKDAGHTRAEAIRHLVQSAVSLDIQLELGKRTASIDEGLRPEQLTSENDA